MSTTDSPPEPAIEKRDHRSRDLDRLDDVLDEIYRKIDRGQIRDTATENTRVRQWQAFGQLIEKKRKLLKDLDLDEMDRRLEKVEQARYK